MVIDTFICLLRGMCTMHYDIVVAWPHEAKIPFDVIIWGNRTTSALLLSFNIWRRPTIVILVFWPFVSLERK